MNLMELIDAYAELQSEVDYLQDQGTTNQMATIYPETERKCTEACNAVVEAVEKLEADAARYRWLRDKAFSDIWIDYGGCYPRLGLDAAIDAAMKEATNGQGT